MTECDLLTIGSCRLWITVTTSIITTVEYMPAWLFDIVVRLQVWYPVDLGSRPGGVTALSLL